MILSVVYATNELSSFVIPIDNGYTACLFPYLMYILMYLFLTLCLIFPGFLTTPRSLPL